MEYLYHVMTLVTLWLVDCTSGQNFFTKTDLKGVLKTFNEKSCDVSQNSGATRYYRYLQRSDKNTNVLYVGAMNNLYKVQLSDMRCLNHLELKADNDTIGRCKVQGRDEIECQNHIRVVMEFGDSLSMCGTGAYSPIERVLNDNLVVNETGISKGISCPFDPWDNYTAHLTTQGNPGNATVPYFGMFKDFIKSSPLFYRPQFVGLDGVTYSEKVTDREDIKWLNSPQFVGTFDDEEKVMFFFRETAVENTDSTNKIYSRVGKVCKQEHTGILKKWLSFQKARLICSDFFDDIYDVYQTGDLFFALFRKKSQLYKEDTEASAVCVYNKTDIEAVFNGDFLVRTKVNGKDVWETLPSPNPQQYNCSAHRDTPNIFNNLEPQNVLYLLMAQSVQPLYGQAVFVKRDIQFINIAVSEPRTHLQTTGRNIYLASDKGEVYDILMKTTDTTSSFIIEQNPTVYRPFGEKHTIWKMELIENSLVLGTDYEVTQLNLKDHCEDIGTINICIKNTLCKWNKCNDGFCGKAETSVSCDILDWRNVENPDSIVSIKDLFIPQSDDKIPVVEGLYVTLPYKAKIASDDIVWQASDTCSGQNLLQNSEKFAISTSFDLTVKNLTQEIDNGTNYTVCYMGVEKIKLHGYSLIVASDNDQVVAVWKQQFNEWSTAFTKWKDCARPYYDSCSANDGG